MSTQRSGIRLMALLTTLAVSLGMVTVWLNIERTDRAYELRTMEKEYEAKAALAAKLEVERDNLLAPYLLQKTADRLGLGPAGAEQIRRVTAGDVRIPDPEP